MAVRATILFGLFALFFSAFVSAAYPVYSPFVGPDWFAKFGGSGQPAAQSGSAMGSATEFCSGRGTGSVINTSQPFPGVMGFYCFDQPTAYAESVYRCVDGTADTYFNQCYQDPCEAGQTASFSVTFPDGVTISIGPQLRDFEGCEYQVNSYGSCRILASILTCNETGITTGNPASSNQSADPPADLSTGDTQQTEPTDITEIQPPADVQPDTPGPGDIQTTESDTISTSGGEETSITESSEQIIIQTDDGTNITKTTTTTTTEFADGSKDVTVQTDYSQAAPTTITSTLDKGTGSASQTTATGTGYSGGTSTTTSTATDGTTTTTSTRTGGTDTGTGAEGAEDAADFPESGDDMYSTQGVDDAYQAVIDGMGAEDYGTPEGAGLANVLASLDGTGTCQQIDIYGNNFPGVKGCQIASDVRDIMAWVLYILVAIYGYNVATKAR